MSNLKAGNSFDIPDWDYLRAADELAHKHAELQRFDLMLLNLASMPGGFRASQLTITQMGGRDLIKARYLRIVESGPYDMRVETTARGRAFYERKAAPLGEW